MRKKSIAAVIFIIILSGCGNGGSGNDITKNTVVTEGQSEHKEINESNTEIATVTTTERVLSENSEASIIQYKTVNHGDISLKVPSDWMYSEKSGNYYYYGNHGEMLMIQESEALSLINEKYIDNYIEGLGSGENAGEFRADNKKLLDINGYHGFWVSGEQKIDSSDYYIFIYFWNTPSHAYLVCYICEDSLHKKGNGCEPYFWESVNSLSYNGDITSTTTTEKTTDIITTEEKDDVTLGMKNALKSAESYLKVTAFSYDGLIKQLKYEEYTDEEAKYAADNCGADWKEQALKSAKSYLSVTAYSYKGLIKQLEYEKFSKDEATYAADNCGADWKEQAAKSAESYISLMSFSRNSLIKQLEYEGFTQEEAEYGAKAVGY